MLYYTLTVFTVLSQSRKFVVDCMLQLHISHTNVSVACFIGTLMPRNIYAQSKALRLHSSTVACCRRKRGCFAKSSSDSEPHVPGSTENAYDLEPVGPSPTTSGGKGTTHGAVTMTPSAAAADAVVYYNNSAAVSALLAPTASDGHAVITPGEDNREYLQLSPDPYQSGQYAAVWHASGPQNNSPPQHHPVSEAQSPSNDDDDGSGCADGAAQRHDSGLTLVDNKLYYIPDSTPNNDPLYVNAAFHADHSPTTS